MTNWENLRVFITIAEMPSTRKAAQHLNISHSTVARKIQQLEQDFNTSLCIRVADGYRLTASGHQLFEALQPVAKKISLIQQKFSEGRNDLAGSIKLTLPYLLATRVLFADILQFQELYPQIQLQILATDSLVDLNSGQADLAIRFTNSPPPDLIGRKAGAVYQAAYATPEYLACHLNEGNPITWIKPRKNISIEGVEFYFPVKKELSAEVVLNSIELQIQAAINNKGVAFVPCFIARLHPELQRISEPAQRFDIWFLHCKEQRKNQRIKVLRDFLLDKITAISLLSDREFAETQFGEI